MSAPSFEQLTRDDLRRRRWLRWHVLLIGTLTFLVCWGASSALMHAGMQRLSLRYAIALGIGYAIYLALLWLWAQWLLSRDEGAADPGINLSGGSGKSDAGLQVARIKSGGGGDFGGGGASASFDGPTAAIDGEATGTLARGAMEIAAGADEAIVVVVPVAVAVGITLLLGALFGFVVFGLFGVEVLLGVAVEIAFVSVGGALAYKARREGWLRFAMRRTAGPALIVIALAALLGVAIDRWLPEANTLPQAVRLLKG